MSFYYLLRPSALFIIPLSTPNPEPQGFTDTELTMSGVGSSFQWPVND